MPSTFACSPLDGGAQCSAGFEAGNGLADWPGWQRLSGLPPCCVIDSPVDIDAAVPALAWRACGDASAGCSEVANLPRPGSQAAPFIRRAHVSHDAHGQPSLLSIRVAIDSLQVTEDKVFDVTSGAPVASLRSDARPGCYSMFDVGTANGVLLTLDPTQNVAVARGSIRAVTTAPDFRCVFTTTRGGTFPSESGCSDTAYAFDLALAGIVRTAPTSNGFVATPPGLHLSFDFVEGDDVFAQSDDAGWWREYTVLPDGTASIFRGKANRHMTAFRTDGTTMYWIESYGNPDPTGTPTTFEVWSAPYTSSSTTLDQAAQKIATLTSPSAIYRAVAFSGLYAVITGPDATVVRKSDGVTHVVTTGDPNLGFEWLQLVTATEIWSVMGRLNGPTDFALRRYNLGTW
jgi:hypothetical protein